MLTHPLGITGGFAPPNPTSVQTLTSSLSDGAPSILLQQHKRAPSERKLPDDPTHTATLPSSATSEVDGLIAELEGILQKLPTEDPPGSDDIYGSDIGLMYGSDKITWANGGQQGCGGGTSNVQATDEQKDSFRRAVAIVEKLAALGQAETS